MIGYSTETFADRFPDYNTFAEKFNASGFANRLLTGAEYATYNLETIFNLLATRYWCAPFKSNNSMMAEMRVFRTIWEHGAKWQRDMLLYDKLRNVSDEELAVGTQAIHNHAEHPDTAPVNNTTEALPYIDSQNVTTYKKSPRDRYMEMLELENSGVTKDFLDKFSPLFVDILYPTCTDYFEIPEEV